VEEYDHLSVAWLEEGVLDVVVHDVHLVAADAGVPEPVGVGLQHARQSLLDDVWSGKIKILHTIYIEVRQKMF
jgi:hypothetical protein